MGRDYYEILGVKRSASQDEIKRAYRKLAKQHHPDRNPDDPAAERQFTEVLQAYEVLGDPQKRSQYDRFGEAGVGQWSTNPEGRRVYQWGGDSSVNFEDLEDLMSAFGGSGGQRASVFDQFFRGTGRGRPRSAPKRGADEEHRISLSFDQAIHGATVTVRLRSGREGRSETLEVKIPSGVQEGQRIRLRGRGQPGQDGGPRGDLHLVCSITLHEYFTRQGADIYVDVPVTVIEAVLGGEIEVPTLGGRAVVSLPPGTSSGTKLRLKGRGVLKRGDTQRGDQYVVIVIVPPKAVTDEQQRLFEQLREQETLNPRSECAWEKDSAA